MLHFLFSVFKIITYIVVTGASFIVIDGALKDGGESFAVNVLEVSLFDIFSLISFFLEDVNDGKNDGGLLFILNFFTVI